MPKQNHKTSKEIIRLQQYFALKLFGISLGTRRMKKALFYSRSMTDYPDSDWLL